MDYFYVGNGHKNKGLIDLFAKTKIKTSSKTALQIHAHEFFSQAKIINEANEDLSSVLGTELDLVFVGNLTQGVTLNVGYSTFMSTKSLEAVKGMSNAKAASWGWAMIAFKPTLFTNKTDN
jgi:hypothetical protein